jgi:hypothetical protein
MNALDREPATRLLGTRELIRECQELLRGERARLTSHEDYVRQRLAYWRSRAEDGTEDSLAA